MKTKFPRIFQVNYASQIPSSRNYIYIYCLAHLAISNRCIRLIEDSFYYVTMKSLRRNSGNNLYFLCIDVCHWSFFLEGRKNEKQLDSHKENMLVASCRAMAKDLPVPFYYTSIAKDDIFLVFCSRRFPRRQNFQVYEVFANIRLLTFSINVFLMS